MKVFALFFAVAIAAFFHGLGNFFALQWTGVAVTEFKIGMGPTLFSSALDSGTEITFRLVPFSATARPELEAYAAFLSDHPHQHALVVASGMVMNVVSGMIIGIFAITLFPDLSPIIAPKGRPFRWVVRETLFAWIAGPAMLASRFFRYGMKMFHGIIGPFGMFSGFGQTNSDGTPVVSDEEVQERVDIVNKLIETKGAGNVAAYCVLLVIVQMSGLVAAVNLLPLFPLDGGMIAFHYLGTYFGDTVAASFLLLSVGALLYVFFVVANSAFRRRVADKTDE